MTKNMSKAMNINTQLKVENFSKIGQTQSLQTMTSTRLFNSSIFQSPMVVQIEW